MYHEMSESGVIDKTALVFGQMNESPGCRQRVALSALTMAEEFRDKLFETQSGEKIMRFRHGGEGEYVSKEMDNLYAKHGIIPEVTPKEKSAMNGLAERLIRELTENTRTNLQMANLPIRFWVEALQYSVYV